MAVVDQRAVAVVAPVVDARLDAVGADRVAENNLGAGAVRAEALHGRGVGGVVERQQQLEALFSAGEGAVHVGTDLLFGARDRPQTQLVELAHKRAISTR